MSFSAPLSAHLARVLPPAAGEPVALVQASLIEPGPAGPTTALSSLPLSGGRLPGRHLRLLGGRPALYQLVRRVQAAVPRVVLVTSVAPEDDALLPIVSGAGVEVFRGAVHDQVGRLSACTDALDLGPAQPLCRVLPDAALIDPGYLRAGLEALRACGGGAVEFQEDLAEELCQGLGAGFFTVGALKLVDGLATAAVHRADVLGYLHEHPHAVGLGRVPLPASLDALRGGHRLLLQTAEDLALLEAIYLRLYQGAPIDTGAAISFLNGDPVLASLNRGVLRRGATMPPQAGWRAR